MRGEWSTGMNMRSAGHHGRIVTDPAVLAGAPTVRGTGVAVEQILAELAVSPGARGLLAEPPELTIADVQAALNCARAVPTDARVQAAGRDRQFRRMLKVARHSEIEGDALLEELEREDAAAVRDRRPEWSAPRSM
jgi:uncharacterized protein (DUF433 family)